MPRRAPARLVAALALLVAAAGAPGPTRAAPEEAPADPAAVDPTTAPVTPQDRAAVSGLLGTVDRPVAPEAWRALGPGAAGALADVAASREERPSRRARALEGLAAFGGARAEALHLELARDGSAPRALRGAAVRGLGRLLPPARLAAEALPLLEDRDASVRSQAAAVLARRAPAQACAPIRARAAREPSAPGLARAARRCGERQAGTR